MCDDFDVSFCLKIRSGVYFNPSTREWTFVEFIDPETEFLNFLECENA